MSTRVVVFSSSCMSLPLIVSLQQAGQLAGVVFAISDHPQRQMDSQQLAAHLQQLDVPRVQYNPQQPDSVIAALDHWLAGQGSGITLRAGVIFSFGPLLPAVIIDFFAGLLVNLHASDLPNYRGSMPVYWQLRHGASEIPLTLHQVEASADTGAIGLQTRVTLHPFDTFQTANVRLMNAAPALLAEALSLMQQGTLKWQPQREKNAADFYACDVTAAHLQADLQTLSARQLVSAARAGNPNYGVSFNSQWGPLQLMQASLSSQPAYGVRPGTVLMVDKFRGWIVATRDGSVALDVVIHQSGYFSGYQFAVANAIEAGTVLNSM